MKSSDSIRAVAAAVLRTSAAEAHRDLRRTTGWVGMVCVCVCVKVGRGGGGPDLVVGPKADPLWDGTVLLGLLGQLCLDPECLLRRLRGTQERCNETPLSIADSCWLTTSGSEV